MDLLGRSTGRERPAIAADRFGAEVCRLLQLELDMLASRARDRSTAEMRHLVATLGVERWGHTGLELAAVRTRTPMPSAGG